MQNPDLIEIALMRHYLDDADVLTLARRLSALEAVTAADVQALAEQLYGPGQRIEVFGVAAAQEEAGTPSKQCTTAGVTAA